MVFKETDTESEQKGGRSKEAREKKSCHSDQRFRNGREDILVFIQLWTKKTSLFYVMINMVQIDQNE